jgi:hypothetical protein
MLKVIKERSFDLLLLLLADSWQGRAKIGQALLPLDFAKV